MPVALVADNDPGVRALLGDLARRAGFEVRLAADGRAALEALEGGGIQLLVCDLDMPRLSGQQVLTWIASLPLAPTVLVVSGYVDAAIEQDLGRHPFVAGVLRKPFDVLGFLARVRELAAGFERQQCIAAPPAIASPGESGDAGTPGEGAAADAGENAADGLSSRGSGPAPEDGVVDPGVDGEGREPTPAS